MLQYGKNLEHHLSTIEINKQQLTAVLNECYINQLEEIIAFCDILVVENLRYKKDFVDFLSQFFLESSFVKKLVEKLNQNSISSKLYNHLIWLDNKVDTALTFELYSLELDDLVPQRYGSMAQKKLEGNYSIITRTVYDHWRGKEDFLQIDKKIQTLFRLFYPKPFDYELLKIEEPYETQYSYTNENGVFQFISTIQEMLQNNLVEFGKTNEKPLAKTLNMLKASTGTEEFYTDKKSNTLATDMLTRSFSFFYWQQKRFESTNLESLHRFIALQFDNQLEFFISRIFASHLKKVRFDFYYTSQSDMFDIIKIIVNNLIGKNWVKVDNILNFCKYRDLYFHLESSAKTDTYYMKTNDDEIEADKYYFEIFYEPLLKASLFYLGALGVLELKYNDPKSPYDITAQSLSYISVWDSLEYVKLTDLGLYTLGVNKTYKVKEIKKKTSNIKFDEFKPMITVDTTDTITIAKIEPYTEKQDDKYILSYSKIFKDCSSYKTLVAKIDAFYKLFDRELPKVFDHYFNEIKQNANMLKKEPKLITIELKNNKKLLHLFMSNKKLQELTIKASGYRVIVSKDDITKLTKIVKDNGFFIEF